MLDLANLGDIDSKLVGERRPLAYSFLNRLDKVISSTLFNRRHASDGPEIGQ